jgi:hypothetical protein
LYRITAIKRVTREGLFVFDRRYQAILSHGCGILSQVGTHAELTRLCSLANDDLGSLVRGDNCECTNDNASGVPCQDGYFFPLGTRSSLLFLITPVAIEKSGVLNESFQEAHILAYDDDGQHERIFTLSEANRLIPRLHSKLSSIHKAKAVLLRTKEDIEKANAKAEYGGGSTVGHLYISGLQQVSANLQAIHELGILVKDLDLGLCDFPHLRDGRVVYLCWKLGEQEVLWWHETTTGYKDRCPLEG